MDAGQSGKNCRNLAARTEPFSPLASFGVRSSSKGEVGGSKKAISAAGFPLVVHQRVLSCLVSRKQREAHCWCVAALGSVWHLAGEAAGNPLSVFELTSAQLRTVTKHDASRLIP